MKRLILVSVWLAACGHGEGNIDNHIGTACVSDRDCADRCYIGGEFPGGFCSQPCLGDADCPGDTYCIDEGGGVCMFSCDALDCGRLGPGWHCRDRDRLNGGNINVCSGG